MSPCSDRGRARVGRILAVSILAAISVGLLSNPAYAHAVLDRSDPVAGAVLSGDPTIIRLWFTEDISPAFSSAKLVDAHGRIVGGASLIPDSADPRQIRLSIPALSPGAYGVIWQVLSESDGHPTSGVLVFSVGAPGTGVSPSVLLGNQGAASSVEVVLRWIALCMLAGVIGGLAVAAYVISVALRRADGSTQMALVRGRLKILKLSCACALGGVLVGVATLIQEARLVVPVAGAASGLASVSHLVLTTRWGHLWLARELAMVTVAGVLFLLVRRSIPWERRSHTLLALAAGFSLAVVVIQALDSHAAAVDSSRALAIAADAAHLLTACLWIGALPALILLAWPRSDDEVTTGQLIRACRTPFSELALTGALLVVITGLYSAGRQVGSVASLTGTTYGKTLAIKSVLVLTVVAIAAVNATRQHRGGTSKRLVTLEAGVGALLLVAAAVLTANPPARQTPSVASPTTSKTVSGSVADLVVSVSITPNVPGVNGMTVLAASSRRPAPAPVDGVTLVLSRGQGTSVVALDQVEAGRYFSTSSLDAAGEWQVTAVIHRAGKTLNVPMHWSVAAAAPKPAPVSQGRPLAPWVNAMALALLLVGVCVALLYVGRRRKRRDRFDESGGAADDAGVLAGSAARGSS